MGDSADQGKAGVSRRHIGAGTAVRTTICCLVIASGLAAFPAMAAAVTTQPLLAGVSATATSNGANLHGTIYPYGLDTTYRYEYGTTTAYGTNIPVPDSDIGSAGYPGSVEVPQTITGLPSGTTYHFRLSAHNGDGTTTSVDQTFTTTGTPPTVLANPATETAEGFELSGSVNPNGFDAKYHFEYGTTTAYGTNLPVPEADVGSGSSAVSVSQEAKSLLPNTIYHFRLTAHGTGTSASTTDQTFTTPPSGPAAPSAVVEAPLPISGGYKLKGQVNPNGLETTYHFEFGTSTSYGTNLPVPDEGIGSGTNAVPVSQEVTGLSPATTYHYRIVATNSKGPTDSTDEAFTTAPEKPVVTATPVTEDAEGFHINGTINANGGDTTYEFEFGITEAYGSTYPAKTEADAGSGTTTVAVSQLVGALPPNVPYHYRLVAKNGGGTSISNDIGFVTPAEKSTESPSPIITQPPPPVIQPTPPPPSNQFTAKSAPPKGSTATVTLGLPGPGSVSISGKQLKAIKTSAGSAGTLSLKLKLTGAGMKALGKAKGKKLTVMLTIVFQPVGGSPSTVHKTVTFKKSG